MSTGGVNTPNQEVTEPEGEMYNSTFSGDILLDHCCFIKKYSAYL